ncbi:hypothetical protein BDW74DRAFT_179249 [Aspergillus multicolor]|uniref:uncharacterized protein n=1 Tax=Aspergillus multicolor TaxID=41759 RepID=UPI003CCD074F
MHFKATALASLLSLAAAGPISARESSCATNAVTTLNSLTEEINTLKTTTQNINAANFFVGVPNVISGTVNTITKASNAVTTLQCNEELSEEDQKKVCTAAEAFVTADEGLIKSLSERKNLLTLTPFAPPLLEVSRQLERVTDNVVFSALEAAPTCAGSVKELAQALGDDVKQLEEDLDPNPQH